MLVDFQRSDCLLTCFLIFLKEDVRFFRPFVGAPTERFSCAWLMPDGGGARRHGTLSDALRRRAHTLRTRASEPSGIRLVDKLLFCAGVTFIPVTEWVMIVHPYRFSYWDCPARLH